MNEENFDDFIARLNIEGKRDVFLKNQDKIDYVLGKVGKYIEPGANACDVGVGNGYTLETLNSRGLNCTGVDIAEYSVKHLQERFEKKGLSISVVHGDLSKFHFERPEYDLFTCFDVLEHIPELSAALENVHVGLKRGGYLIATLPLHENLEKSMTQCPNCGHRYHRVGHFHSFADIKAVREMLNDRFNLLEFGIVHERHPLEAIINPLKDMKYKLRRKKKKITIYFVAQAL